jgi:predicted metal-dependent HD superfamily phosphohydrolase
LNAAWSSAMQSLPATAPAELLDTTRNALLAAYREPQRHYHTLQHLHECLALFESVRHLAEHPAEVALALWFHDAVYDVQGHDNERRSADWASTFAQAAGLPADSRSRLDGLIMATRHDALPDTPDGCLLVDIDLAILGAAPARFDDYGQQVRREYAWVPAPVFQAKRRSILAAFLARQPLYYTPALAARLDGTARANLRRAIEQLAGPG